MRDGSLVLISLVNGVNVYLFYIRLVQVEV